MFASMLRCVICTALALARCEDALAAASDDLDSMFDDLATSETQLQALPGLLSTLNADVLDQLLQHTRVQKNQGLSGGSLHPESELRHLEQCINGLHVAVAADHASRRSQPMTCWPPHAFFRNPSYGLLMPAASDAMEIAVLSVDSCTGLGLQDGWVRSVETTPAATLQTPKPKKTHKLVRRPDESPLLDRIVVLLVALGAVVLVGRISGIARQHVQLAVLEEREEHGVLVDEEEPLLKLGVETRLPVVRLVVVDGAERAEAPEERTTARHVERARVRLQRQRLAAREWIASARAVDLTIEDGSRRSSEETLVAGIGDVPEVDARRKRTLDELVDPVRILGLLRLEHHARRQG